MKNKCSDDNIKDFNTVKIKEFEKLISKQNKDIDKLKSRIKNLEDDFKKIIGDAIKIHCIQPYCSSTNIEFIGYDTDDFGNITLDKKYKCRDCGFKWVDKKPIGTKVGVLKYNFKNFK